MSESGTMHINTNRSTADLPIRFVTVCGALQSPEAWRLTETDAIRMILIRTNDFLPHMPDRVLDAAARRLRGGRKSSDADHVESGSIRPNQSGIRFGPQGPLTGSSNRPLRSHMPAESTVDSASLSSSALKVITSKCFA